jgi:chaperone modulatory protein CbpM
METDEFVAHAPLGAEVLEAWIEAGWLVPRQDGAKRNFFAVDLARAHLIHDLEHLGVNDEGIPVILDLVDQLHGLRRTLRPPVCDSRTARSHAALDCRRPPRGGPRPDGWRGPRRSRFGRTSRTLANSKVQGARLTPDLGARRRQKHHAPHGGRNELARPSDRMAIPASGRVEGRTF